MANVEKPCMAVRKEEPWVKPFDQFGKNWKLGANGQIDDADLERWRSLYMLQDARFPQVAIPSFPSSALCPYFRANMYRRQFEEQVVIAERTRTKPLSYEEQLAKAEEVKKLAETLTDNILKESEAVAPHTSIYFRAMEDRIEWGLKKVLENLKWDQPKICGVGIGVHNGGGFPFAVDYIVEGGVAVGRVEPGKTLILEVDGENISSLSFKSLINRIRGPQGSPVMLTLLSLDSAEVTIETFRRDWCATDVKN